MSQKKRTFQRIEAFFSRIRPVAPDSPLRAAAERPAPGASVEDTQPESGSPTPAMATAASFFPSAAASLAGRGQDLLKGIDRGEKMGFTYDQEKVTSLEESPLPMPDNALCMPLMVSGTTIGTVQAAGNEAGWTAQEIEIVSAVAAQLARHLENLRRLEQNEKHAQA